MARSPIPLSSRPLDLLFIVSFSVFTLTSTLYAPISAFNVPVSADSPHPVLRWMHSVASRTDTLIISNPEWARFVNGFDFAFNSWFQVIIIYAIIKGRDWIRVPYFYYHAIHLYGTVMYTSIALFGSEPVPGKMECFLMNLPYAIIPLLFAYRIRSLHPFTVDDKKKR